MQGFKKKEIVVDDVPSRAFMWRKGRENKDGELVDPKAKNMADYLVSLNMRVSRDRKSVV